MCVFKIYTYDYYNKIITTKLQNLFCNEILACFTLSLVLFLLCLKLGLFYLDKINISFAK